MRVSIREGGGPAGISVMKFTLTYQGELRANDGYRRKWAIRQHFHPQLQELWLTSPILRTVKRHRHVAVGGYMIFETHHSRDDGLSEPNPSSLEGEKHIDLCSPISVGPKQFLPLVRDTYALQCGLRVIFLRKEPPGRIYQGGDLDNRLKTLFDALSMPNDQQIVADDPIDEPIYCLMENDRLISSLAVDTDRLLSMPNGSLHDVNLIIEVDVRVTQSRVYNHPFLGG